MSALTAAMSRVRGREQKAPRPKLSFGDTWWRHLVGIVAAVSALFPVWFLCSAAFSREDSVSGTSYLPNHFTLRNFGAILHNHVRDRSSTGFVDSHFLRWLLNTIIIATITAIR